MPLIARAVLTLFTAWAFIHAALLTPAVAQSAGDDTVSRGYVVPGPKGQGNVIVSAPQTMSPNVSGGTSPNVNIYVDSNGAYSSRYGQQAGNGQTGNGMRTVPLVPGALPKAQ
jgi:hypothetical protein